MLRNTSLIVCFAVAALVAGCGGSKTTAPPPDNRAADVQAVKDVEAAWLKDVDSKDPDKWVSYFTDDGSALYPGTATLDGKAAIKAAVTPIFADKNFSLTFQSTRSMASKGDDMVYSQGTFSMTTTNPKTKKPKTENGKFLTVYTKEADGSWKAVASTFNSDTTM
jgi:uncharacterized protein (TIGR02246 family)